MAARKKTAKRKKTTRSKSTIIKAPSAPASKVKALADSIFNDREDIDESNGDLSDEFEEVSKEIAEDNPTKIEPAFQFQETPIPVKKEEVEPTPVYFTEGLSPRNPIKIKKTEKEIFWYLNKSFGINDGSYFVHNDITETRMIHGERKKFKTLYIEDGNGFRYTLWFDLSPISLIHNTQYGL